MARGSLLNADNHGVRADEVLNSGLAEAGVAHPALAVRAGVVESAGGLDQHIQAHHQTECVLRTVIVNDAFVDNECATLRDGFVGFGYEHFLGVQVPIVQNVTHDDHIGFGQRHLEEIAGLEVQPSCQAERLDVLLENRADLGEIKAHSEQMWVGHRNLRGRVALGSPHVDGRNCSKETLPRSTTQHPG